MGHGKHKGFSRHGAPVVPPADYNVTGDGNPSPNCDYNYLGEYDAHSSYERVAGTWFIWWRSGAGWTISKAVGSVPENKYWTRFDPAIVGEYDPVEGVTGNPIVSAGSH